MVRGEGTEKGVHNGEEEKVNGSVFEESRADWLHHVTCPLALFTLYLLSRPSRHSNYRKSSPQSRYTMTTSRSPSPPGPPPQDSAPGIRATALQKTFDGALKATLNKCSYDNFAACFPTTASYRPETLESFWKDFTGRLGQVCKVSDVYSSTRLLHVSRWAPFLY
jgi:hypothetical protein